MMKSMLIIKLCTLNPGVELNSAHRSHAHEMVPLMMNSKRIPCTGKSAPDNVQYKDSTIQNRPVWNSDMSCDQYCQLLCHCIASCISFRI